MSNFFNMDEYIDSRDIISRLEELENEYGEHGEDFEDVEELEALRALNEKGEDATVDWRYGVTLIHEDYFEQYAEELAEDIALINRNALWPLNHIDWKAAAEELKIDYTTVDFDGETYYVRY